MITFEIKGTNRTMKNLINYSFRIKERLWADVLFIGNQVRNKIKIDFPEVTMTVEQNPKSLSYSIIVGDMTICSVSGFAILTQAEKSSSFKGRGFFESAVELENYKNELVRVYFNQAKERIMNTMHTILK